MSTQLPAPARNGGLDLMRGVAILLVLLNHISVETIPMLPEVKGATASVYWKLRNFGWSGVDLFFVLSGFLISGLLFKEIETTGSIQPGRFWVRRAFKILPSYLFFLGVMALTAATAWLDTTSLTTIGQSLAKHLLFCQNYLAENPNGPTWSLAVEEHFYLLLPCLLLFLLSRSTTQEQFGRRVVVMGASVIIGTLLLRIGHTVLGGVNPGDFRLTHFRIDGLLMGVMLQFLVRQKHPIVKAVCSRPWLSLTAAAILISPAFVLGRVSPIMFSVGYTALSVGYAILVLLFAKHFLGAATTLPGRALAHVGKYSYNIYLWNFVLLALPIPGYLAVHHWIAAHIPSAPAALILHGLFFATVSLLVGFIVTHLVEFPCLKLRELLFGPQKKATPTAQTITQEPTSPTSPGVPA